MTDPPFSSPLEWVLYVCSKMYHIAVTLRISLYEKGILRSKRLPCKVISIGNITVGGTGKTPMVHYVASLLKGLGLEVAVISRGYGGRQQRAGGIVSDGKRIFMGPRASGDEPQLLASKLEGIPVLVGKDRYRAGRLAISRFGSSVLVLDDAFQHLSLRRDLDLLLLDSVRPLGNGHCVPRGTLREPADQLKRANAFVLTRCYEEESLTHTVSVIKTHAQGHPVFKCGHVPEHLFVAGEKEPLDLLKLQGRRLFAFSGIAQNDDFHAKITGLGGYVAGSLKFPDHHLYSSDDLISIWKSAKDLNVDNIITTEKDYFNIGFEPQKRAHSPSRQSGTAGLASESKNGKLPYGRRFSAACRSKAEIPSQRGCRDIQIPLTPPLLVLAITISFGDDAGRFEDYIKKWAFSP